VMAARRCFTYSLSMTPRQNSCSICLSQPRVTVEVDAERRYQHVFHIVIGHSRRKHQLVPGLFKGTNDTVRFDLRASSEDEMIEWMAALKRKIESYIPDGPPAPIFRTANELEAEVQRKATLLHHQHGHPHSHPLPQPPISGLESTDAPAPAAEGAPAAAEPTASHHAPPPASATATPAPILGQIPSPASIAQGLMSHLPGVSPAAAQSQISGATSVAAALAQGILSHFPGLSPAAESQSSAAPGAAPVPPGPSPAAIASQHAQPNAEEPAAFSLLPKPSYKHNKPPPKPPGQQADRTQVDVDQPMAA
ncbi:hypothetical protein HK104_008193, partial [Borealophlyctis nickersoniae]